MLSVKRKVVKNYLLPISTTKKMIAERVFLVIKDLIVNIIRPATVCGVPRMRLDIFANLHNICVKNIIVLVNQ